MENYKLKKCLKNLKSIQKWIKNYKTWWYWNQRIQYSLT